MPSSVLASQIATLEMLGADEDGVILDVSHDPEAVTRAAVDWLDARCA